MALVTQGLTSGGQTTHYQFQYDNSILGGLEPARTNAVIASCEGDFNLMTTWFRNTTRDDLDFRIPVNVTQNSGGASWNFSGRSLTVTVNPGGGNASVVRYLLVAEMVEQFMRNHKTGWWGSGTEKGASVRASPASSALLSWQSTTWAFPRPALRIATSGCPPRGSTT